MIKILPKNSSGEILISITLDEADVIEYGSFNPKTIVKTMIVLNDNSLIFNSWKNSSSVFDSSFDISVDLKKYLGIDRYKEIRNILNSKLKEFLNDPKNKGLLVINSLNLL